VLREAIQSRAAPCGDRPRDGELVVLRDPQGGPTALPRLDDLAIVIARAAPREVMRAIGAVYELALPSPR
jgi:hypothetical protein